MSTTVSARWFGVSRWVMLLLGIVCVIVGIALIARPFHSLAVLIVLVAAGLILTGLGDLAERSDAPDARPMIIAGSAWILLGSAVLLWPGLNLQVLSVLVGVALIAQGAARARPALQAETDTRTAALLRGVASVILGVVVLSWRDTTLLVVAVVFGVQLVCLGLTRLWNALRDPRPDTGVAVPGSASPRRRLVRTVRAAVTLVASLVLAGISLRLNEGTGVDAFYSAPGQIPPSPGVLLRTEPMSRGLPVGAQAWRILYTTTRSDDVPALASAIIVAPVSPPPGPRPVIAWGHGTTGIAENCAPSVLKEPFAVSTVPALDQALANGWVLVASDFIGLGTQGPHPYLVGQQDGRAMLDAVRAAHQMPEVNLADKTVIWGHSQGGVNALWAGILAPIYAPDVNIVGVVSLSPGSDLSGMLKNFDGLPGGTIFASYMIQGYSDTYPDVRFDAYIRPTARIVVRELASRCMSESAIFTSAIEALLLNKSIWAIDPTSGSFGERLQENVPLGPSPAPLLIGQGLADPLVLPALQAAYVRARCEADVQIDYRTYAGIGHVDIIGEASPLIPDLLTWSQDRFDGKPAPSTCE